MISPAIVDLLLKFSVHLGLSSTTNHMGEEETIMATTLLGKYCSTQITAPVPINSSRIPLIAASLIFFLMNNCSPLNILHTSIKLPETIKRTAPRTNGGKPYIAYL